MDRVRRDEVSRFEDEPAHDAGTERLEDRHEHVAAGVERQPPVPTWLTNLYRQVVLWEGEGTGTKRGLVLTMGDVLFGDKSAELLPAARTKLDSLADYLNAFPHSSIQIEGHTDNAGDMAFNRDLSRRRAEAVSAYLVRKHVAPHRLSSVGLADSRPVADNSTAAGRQRNRRVEIILDRRRPRSDLDSAHPSAADIRHGAGGGAPLPAGGIPQRRAADTGAGRAMARSRHLMPVVGKDATEKIGFDKSLHPEGNEVIAALPDDVRSRLLPEFEPVRLPLGKVLYEPGEMPAHVYFPVNSIVALLCMMEDGFSAGVAVLGCDSLAGLVPLISGGQGSTWAIVQNAGSAYRLPAARLLVEFQRSQGARDTLMRQVHALLAQTAQTAACNRHHTIYQQLARWLLMSLDRLPDDHLVLTQDLIANMLGVRREGVTEAAGRLQKRGIIEYRRGHIRLLDRVALERASCECYAATRAGAGLPADWR